MNDLPKTEEVTDEKIDFILDELDDGYWILAIDYKNYWDNNIYHMVRTTEDSSYPLCTTSKFYVYHKLIEFIDDGTGFFINGHGKIGESKNKIPSFTEKYAHGKLCKFCLNKILKTPRRFPMFEGIQDE